MDEKGKSYIPGISNLWLTILLSVVAAHILIILAVLGFSHLKRPAPEPAAAIEKTEPVEKTGQPAADTRTYIVVEGDTLGKIAKKTGTSVETIRKMNNLDSDMLRIGQKLMVPAVKAEEGSGLPGKVPPQ